MPPVPQWRHHCKVFPLKHQSNYGPLPFLVPSLNFAGLKSRAKACVQRITNPKKKKTPLCVRQFEQNATLVVFLTALKMLKTFMYVFCYYSPFTLVRELCHLRLQNKTIWIRLLLISIKIIGNVFSCALIAVLIFISFLRFKLL